MLWNIFCLWSGRGGRESDLWRLVFVARIESFCWLRVKILFGRLSSRLSLEPDRRAWCTWLRNYVSATHVVTSQNKISTFPARCSCDNRRVGTRRDGVARRTARTARDFPSREMQFSVSMLCFFFAHSITSGNMQKGRKKFQSSPAVPTQRANEANVIRSREWEERRARRSHREWKYVLILCVSKKPQEFSLTVRQKTQKSEENNIFFLQSLPFYSRFFFGEAEMNKQ